MKTQKEIRTLNDSLKRSDAINNFMITREAKIADLEVQVRAYQWGILICGLIIGVSIL